MSLFLSLRLLLLKRLALLELAQVPKLAALPEMDNLDVVLMKTLLAAPMTSTAVLRDTPVICPKANVCKVPARAYSLTE